MPAFAGKLHQLTYPIPLPSLEVMFEITADDITSLNDVDLRALIADLCESEARCRGLSTSAVTWGGQQTAKDGGLDVRVEFAASTVINGYIPMPSTGFQVKKPDMPRHAILEEMRPRGALRPAIVELAKSGGAYIIVSSSGSTADSALQDRRDAMAEAVKDLPERATLTLDFYDRRRIASWVGNHAGTALWVRSRIGRALPGWRPFGRWSGGPASAEPGYLTDDRARVTTGDKDDGEGLSALDAINRIRNVLRMPGKVVRLVGLSGVGKTRFAEALFEPDVGVASLERSLVLYTNVAEAPQPGPVTMASDLIARRTPAILVVDNCTPELHRQLAEAVNADGTAPSCPCWPRSPAEQPRISMRRRPS